jgi:hypothetical protein
MGEGECPHQEISANRGLAGVTHCRPVRKDGEPFYMGRQGGCLIRSSP